MSTSTTAIDRNQIALCIQQPWIELILNGVKSVEVRKANTQQRGRILLYASKKFSPHPAAESALTKYRLERDQLSSGVLLGSVELYDARPARSSDARAACVAAEYLDSRFAWRMRDPLWLPEPLPIKFIPYGIWFYPFQRKKPGNRRRKRRDTVAT